MMVTGRIGVWFYLIMRKSSGMISPEIICLLVRHLHYLFIAFFLGYESNISGIGGNVSQTDWKRFMFPQPTDHKDFFVPVEMMLPLKGYVRETEFRNPDNLDIFNEPTLLAVKNGRTTGTTFGGVNGLESVTQHIPEHGISMQALEYIVVGYDTQTLKSGRFSSFGDSGSIVAGRDGRIIGQLTSGAGGVIDSVDRSYITPFFSLKTSIEKIFPDCQLLEV